KAPKWSLLFYWRLSMRMMFLKSGTSRRPFPWNTTTNADTYNDQCTHQTTFCFALVNVDGLNVRLRKSCSSRRRHVRTGMSRIHMGSGAVLLARHMPRNMD